MKKKLPVFLFVLCLFAVLGGVAGFIKFGRAESSPGSGVTGISQAKPTAVRGGAELLDVKMPAPAVSEKKRYEGFTVSFNAANRTPEWVAWELLGSETEGDSPRHNKYWQDESLEGCPSTRDYANSGYDRGHLCPAADQKWSRQAMEDCFSMANIAPQDHALNTGAWKTLENKERQWAVRDSAILIVAGPIYSDSDTERIGEAGVRVPGAFFKVLAAPFLPEPRGIAFVYPNMTSPGNMENYVVTIDEVERITGFDFFHALPDDVEEAVESRASFRDWNRKK